MITKESVTDLDAKVRRCIDGGTSTNAHDLANRAEKWAAELQSDPRADVSLIPVLLGMSIALKQRFPGT
jgi:hypothetical protein